MVSANQLSVLSRLLLTCFLSVCWYLSSLSATYADPTKLHIDRPLILGMVDFPPYTFLNDEQKPDGIYYHQVADYCEKIGIRLDARLYPAKRLYHYLGRGEIDMFVGINTAKEIQGKVTSSTLPVGSIVLNGYYLNDTIPTTPKLSDFTNTRAGLMLGYSYGKSLDALRAKENGNTIHLVQNHESGFGMLKHNRLDLFFDYAGPSEPVLEKLDLPEIKSFQVFSLECYINFNNDVPKLEQILERINARMRAEKGE